MAVGEERARAFVPRILPPLVVVALSLPEMIILRRVLKLPLIAAFVGIVAVGIMLTGYLFNFILAH